CVCPGLPGQIAVSLAMLGSCCPLDRMSEQRSPRLPMDIAFFGSSLLSAWWNGAATYYRGLIRALAARGHQVTFYEPDIFQRQQHRDLEPPEWARVVVYPADEAALRNALSGARNADVIVKASGVGVFDALLEREVLELKRPGHAVVFWD